MNPAPDRPEVAQVSGSLHRRLALGLVLSLVLLAGAQWLVASLAVERLLKEQMAQRLEHDAENLLAALEPGPSGALHLSGQPAGGAYQRPFSGHYFMIVIGTDPAPASQFTSRSLWDASLPLPDGPGPEAIRSEAAGPQGQHLLVVSRRYIKHGQTARIAVAEDMTGLQAGLGTLRRLYGALTAAVVLLVLAVQTWIVRRSLAPLTELRVQLQALAAGQRERLDVAMPSEIAPLVVQLNHLLALLVRRSRRSREALGNLAHGLKTRLAVLVQATEHPALRGEPELLHTLTETAEATRRTIERELRRARLMGESHPGQVADVAAAAQQLTRTLSQLHADKGVKIDLEIAPGLGLAMDPEDLMELLGNLTDNACTWCAGVVRLGADWQDGIRIQVEDDGPGCPPEAFSRIGQRGYRADESRPGSGLGLAIVGDLADSYGGRVSFDPSPTLGGLRVTVHLPGTLYRNTNPGVAP